jgi:diguanylate cyclase (GGDEF)-like protein
MRALGLLGLVVTVAVVGRLDVVTGRLYGFSLFYLMPVAAAGWWFGRRAAVLLAVLASGTWFMADIAFEQAPPLLASIWNGATRLAIFTCIGVLTAIVRTDRQDLRALVNREAALARTCPITGLKNSRAFHEQIQAELTRCQREGRPFCVAYIDLDNFKTVNDRYGHTAGDEALVSVARVLRGELRRADVSARIAGDEFAVTLWDVTVDQAREVLQRVVDGVNHVGRSYPEAGLGASAGIAYFAEPPTSAESALQTADEAMYSAKRSGKGTIALAVDTEDPSRSDARVRE